jgi:hypothetical protein
MAWFDPDSPDAERLLNELAASFGHLLRKPLILCPASKRVAVSRSVRSRL